MFQPSKVGRDLELMWSIGKDTTYNGKSCIRMDDLGVALF